MDVILKCVDQPVPQPPITSLIAYKDQGYAIVEFATPELAETARGFVIDKAPTYELRWSDHAPLTITYDV